MIHVCYVQTLQLLQRYKFPNVEIHLSKKTMWPKSLIVDTTRDTREIPVAGRRSPPLYARLAPECSERVELFRAIADHEHPDHVKSRGWPFLRRNQARMFQFRDELGYPRHDLTINSIPQKGYARRQFFRHAKGEKLEPAVIKLKRKLASDCKNPELPLSTMAHAYDGDSATFEFFSITAPLLAGEFFE